MAEERRKGEAEEAVAAALKGNRRGEGEAEEGKEGVEEGMSVWWSIEWLPKSVGTTNALFPLAPPLSRILLLLLTLSVSLQIFALFFSSLAPGPLVFSPFLFLFYFISPLRYLISFASPRLDAYPFVLALPSF